MDNKLNKLNTIFLGLLIDEELSWKYHINHVAMKISKLTGIIAKARHYLPLKTSQNIYYTMIYPYLIYCIAVWTNTYPTRLYRPIYMIQKKIVRIMTFSKYREETRPILTSLKLLNIYELNLYFAALFMYSYFHENLPMFYKDYFTTNNKIHTYLFGTSRRSSRMEQLTA